MHIYLKHRAVSVRIWNIMCGLHRCSPRTVLCLFKLTHSYVLFLKIYLIVIANKAIFDSYVFRTSIKLTDLYAKRSLL